MRVPARAAWVMLASLGVAAGRAAEPPAAAAVDGPVRRCATEAAPWQQLDMPVSWSPRHEHSTFVFQDRLWVAGGMRPPLSNDVWSLHLPVDWAP